MKDPPLESNSTATDMHVIVGGALAPVQTEPPRQTVVSRPSPGLRLPSFHALGIAAPHPDRFGQAVVGISQPTGEAATLSGAVREQRADSELLEAFETSRLGGGDKEQPERRGSDSLLTPLQRCVATLTPPAEGGQMDWQNVPTVQAGSMHSPLTDQGRAASPQPHDDDTTINMPAPALDDHHAIASTTGPPLQDTTLSSRPWLGGAIQTLLHSIITSPVQSNPLRILSHALPSPSPDGHIFSDIISAIHESTPVSPTIWINVFHAVPGRFNLADLPTSPPSTPGPAIGGEDYFTQKVFDSAVPIADYQTDLSALPRSPRPAVPPSSINVSIVERFVPPSSINEYQNMFDTNGPSILVDRLIELSPNNGTLIFIYPTRAGAQTFMQDYLGPILDPLLRTISVINGLSSDLASSLGRMNAAPTLPTFETMRRRLANLCTDLSNPQNTSNSVHRFLHQNHSHHSTSHSAKTKTTTYTLAHASAASVPLPRSVWAKDWWTKQEKPRVRDTITRYAREATARRSATAPFTDAPTELVQQLLEGVCRRPYPCGGMGEEVDVGVEGSGTRGVSGGNCGVEGLGGVEVGVFVVVRGVRDLNETREGGEKGEDEGDVLMSGE
ncbi:hypothetical protein MBLNU230_g7694t1 [Neophaeotheca triangularis]